MIKKNYFNVLISFIVIMISLYFSYKAVDSYTDEPIKNVYKIGDQLIKAIQYQVVQENYGESEGRNVTESIVTYKSPYLLKIESNNNTKTIEIYNKNKYIYYDEAENKIHVKECFPIEVPYISQVEKKMEEVLTRGDYEFLGFEESNNIRLEIIGTKYKADGNNYMHKLWIGVINNVNLLFKEEYFINNVVVSKSNYTYMKVNEQIDQNIFEMESLPKSVVINSGVVPKYVDEYKDAQQLLNFKLKLPQKLPDGFFPSEIAVIPPIVNPKFYCIYYNSNGKRIYLNESTDIVRYNPNAKLTDADCEIKLTQMDAIIIWKQGNIYINISSSIGECDNAVFLAESIANSRLVKK